MVNDVLYTDQHKQSSQPKKFNCNSSVEKPTQNILATALSAACRILAYMASDDPVSLLRDWEKVSDIEAVLHLSCQQRR